MKKDNKKVFIIRKYVRATSAREAILLDKKTQVDDVYIDPDWQRKANEQLASCIGFDNGIYPD